MDYIKEDTGLSHECLIRIQSVYDTLKKAEKRVADTLLVNPKSINNKSIFDAAKEIGCSEATLVRFSKKLGYSGYPELKASVLKKENDKTINLYEEIKPHDTPVNVANSVIKTTIQSLMDTLSLIDNDEYEKVVQALLEADKILFIGSGDAYVVAYTGYLKFSRLGFNASCFQDIDLQIIEASKLKKNDVIFAISHSGRTQTIYEVMKYGKVSRAKTILITNYPTSPIARIADLVLLTAAFVPDMAGEVMTKRIPELCLLESLYVNTVMRVNKQYIDTLNYSNEVLASRKM